MTNDYKDRARSALLFEYLLHSTAEDVPAPRDQLCRYLECDRKTLAKEIRALRDCGFDIRVKKAGKQNAYYYGRNALSLAELQVWIDEAHAGSYLPAETEEKLDAALEKLGGPRKAGLLRESTVLFNTRKHSDAPILRTVEVLQQAILNHRQASFLYFDWDENHERVYRRNGERYLVQPVGLVNKDDNYYLLTWHAEGCRIAPYRLDRIDAAIVSEEPVSEEALEARGHVAEFTRQAFRMYGGETEQVTLQFTHAAINYVFDKFGRDVSIRKLGKDLYEAELEVQLSPPFWGWLFQFADLMEVTAPEHVLAQYKARIADVRKTKKRFERKRAKAAAEAAAGSGAAEAEKPADAGGNAETAEAEKTAAAGGNAQPADPGEAGTAPDASGATETEQSSEITAEPDAGASAEA